MVSPDQESAKFPVSKFTSYGDNDYEFLTKRHLPINQWENGLNELNEIVSELSSSKKIAKLDQDQKVGTVMESGLNKENPKN